MLLVNININEVNHVNNKNCIGPIIKLFHVYSSLILQLKDAEYASNKIIQWNFIVMLRLVSTITVQNTDTVSELLFLLFNYKI